MFFNITYHIVHVLNHKPYIIHVSYCQIYHIINISFHKYLTHIKHMTRAKPRGTRHHTEYKTYNHVDGKATYLDDFNQRSL